MRSPAEASPVDYVVCAHKAIDQEEVAAQLKPVVEEGRTTFVIIQNGVGNEVAFRDQFPRCSILTCVVRVVLLFLITKLTIIDLGWSHSDQPWNSQSHQIRGYADRSVSQ